LSPPSTGGSLLLTLTLPSPVQRGGIT
jgi:hypothetical protein